jgi:hypothetical protein
MAKANPASTQPKLPLKEPEHPRDMPVFSCRHRALKAAVWQNESNNGPFYNVTVSRSYKDGEKWKESSSFGYDDILPIAELLRTCHGFISREIAKAKSVAKTTAKPGK